MNRLRVALVLLGFTFALCVAAFQSAIAQTASSIYGSVVDAKHQQPLADVRVAAFPLRSSQQVGATSTDVDGNFRISGLGPGVYRLELSKEGYDTTIVSNVRVRRDERVIIAGSLNLSVVRLGERYVAHSYCGKLVQAGVTADVYVVCAGR